MLSRKMMAVAIGTDNGTCMIVEPFAQNELDNNVNPVASTFYAAFSTRRISVS